MDEFPDYYTILGLPPIPPPPAQDIRNAYRKASLRCHPDRHPNLPEAEKLTATQAFQKVADAYYVLSDDRRRREYDRLRAERVKTGRGPGADAFGASGNYFSSFFGHSPDDDDPAEEEIHGERPDAGATFADVFDDLLRPEVESIVPLWKYVGMASGAALGFIVANLPGAALGAAGGNRLGSIRDAKGKSVYSVFAELDSNQKAAILRALAIKVLGAGLS